MKPTASRLARRTGPLRIEIRSPGLSARMLVPAIAAMLSSACGRAQSSSRADTAAARADADSAPPAPGVASGPWEEARRRGVEFRALGQEPGWTLELDRGKTLRYVGDYGQVRISLPAPDPVRDTVAGTISYTARTDSHQVAIVIREEACSDVMSGEAFSHAVTVRIDGRELRGCGRPLATGEVEDIYRLTPANRNGPT